MRKEIIVLTAILLCLPCTSFADLLFKMNIDKTEIGIGETAVVTVSAYCQEAAGLNGLNSWQLGLTVSGTGSVKVVEGSITLFAPFTYDTIMYDNINSPDGSIEDLQLNPVNPPEDSDLGVGGYHAIAQFIIEGLSEGNLAYTIGNFDGDFYGILRDYNFMTGEYHYDGIFDIAASDYQFTIVPEPVSFVMFGLTGIYMLTRKHRKA